MQPEQIQQADLLDILFADRNKMYGAYPLRREYNRRLLTALMLTGAVTCLALIGYYSFGRFKPTQNVFKPGGDYVLLDVKPPVEEIPPPPPPSPPPPPLEQVLTRRFTAQIQIVRDADEKDAPPPIEDLDNSVVGLINQEGRDAPDIVAPPVPANNGVIEAPKHEDENKIWTKVEIESAYPGGLAAWKRFLIRTTKYPEYAQENQIHGTVVVQFIVDREGRVSNIEAISGPEELKAEAIRVIGKSGKWTPAVQNGAAVNSYKRQPITFQLANE